MIFYDVAPTIQNEKPSVFVSGSIMVDIQLEAPSTTITVDPVPDPAMAVTITVGSVLVLNGVL